MPLATARVLFCAARTNSTRAVARGTRLSSTKFPLSESVRTTIVICWFTEMFYTL